MAQGVEQSEGLTVTQADRDAAAAYEAKYGSTHYADLIWRGHRDQNPLVQSHARHRQTAVTAAVEPLREALEKIATGGPDQDPGAAFEPGYGWTSQGNYDDVAYDAQQEVRWEHAQIARAALAQLQSKDGQP